MTAFVVAPDATIRFLHRHAVLHNAFLPSVPLRTADAGIFALLLRFLTPLDPADLRGELQQDRHAEFDQLFRALADARLLIPAGTVGAQRPVSARAELVRLQLGHLANAISEVAADLAAAGPAALDLHGPGDTLALEQRLEALLNAVDGIREGLATEHRKLLEQQLTELRRRGLFADLKLHIGAGARQIAGWVNIDVHPAELSLNINRSLPFPDASARLVFASHVLEHLYYPTEALRFLSECRRVLSTDGRLRVIVPDIERYLRAYATHDSQFFIDRRRTWQRLPEGRTHLEEFLAYAGAGPEPAAFLDAHKYAYDFETLQKVLRMVGFEQVQRSGFQASELPDLRVDQASEVALAQSQGQHYSLFVEAWNG